MLFLIKWGAMLSVSILCKEIYFVRYRNNLLCFILTDNAPEPFYFADYLLFQWANIGIRLCRTAV